MAKGLVGNALVFCLVVAYSLCTSCAYRHELRSLNPNIAENALKKGDKVRIVTEDGRDLRFRIIAVKQDTLRGNNQRVAISEIAILQKFRKEFDKDATRDRMETIGTITLSVLAIGMVIYVASCPECIR